MNLTLLLILTGVALILSMIRLMIGPSTMDRLVSVDTINMIIVGGIALLALTFKNSLYLDIAIVYGILAFLETIIISRYMEGKQ